MKKEILKRGYFADIDTDADLDLFVTRYLDWRIEIDFVAGYGDAPSDVPQSIRQCIHVRRELMVTRRSEPGVVTLLGFLGRKGDLGQRDGNALGCQQRFGLVFVDLHGNLKLLAVGKAGTQREQRERRNAEGEGC